MIFQGSRGESAFRPLTTHFATSGQTRDPRHTILLPCHNNQPARTKGGSSAQPKILPDYLHTTAVRRVVLCDRSVLLNNADSRNNAAFCLCYTYIRIRHIISYHMYDVVYMYVCHEAQQFVWLLASAHLLFAVSAIYIAWSNNSGSTAVGFS